MTDEAVETEDNQPWEELRRRDERTLQAVRQVLNMRSGVPVDVYRTFDSLVQRLREAEERVEKAEARADAAVSLYGMTEAFSKVEAENERLTQELRECREGK